ncbi:MAG: DUF255 domain-containing protein [Bacteroidetes bacterium]|nr:DUF255 domain-containing protein [Bacteroidota bacterium]
MNYFMASKFRALFVLAALGFFSITSLQAQGIAFFDGTYQEALDKAEEEGKLVFIDCYATWCGPCKWMSANVFTDETVGDYFNEHFINVKMNMEKGEGLFLSRDFNIRAYPTLIIVDPTSKEEVHRQLGAQPADGLILFGEQGVVAAEK